MFKCIFIWNYLIAKISMAIYYVLKGRFLLLPKLSSWFFSHISTRFESGCFHSVVNLNGTVAGTIAFFFFFLTHFNYSTWYLTDNLRKYLSDRFIKNWEVLLYNYKTPFTTLIIKCKSRERLYPTWKPPTSTSKESKQNVLCRITVI